MNCPNFSCGKPVPLFARVATPQYCVWCREPVTGQYCYGCKGYHLRGAEFCSETSHRIVMHQHHHEMELAYNRRRVEAVVALKQQREVVRARMWREAIVPRAKVASLTMLGLGALMYVALFALSATAHKSLDRSTIVLMIGTFGALGAAFGWAQSSFAHERHINQESRREVGIPLDIEEYNIQSFNPLEPFQFNWENGGA